MGKRLRKIISILLVIVMIIGMCPNSVVLAKESMDSGMTATSTDAEEGITEDSNTEESDPFIESEKSDTSTETDIQIDEETYPAFNPEPVIIDGVRISVSAAEGVFPEGASLSVAKVSNAELGAVEEALDVERDETEKVAISYTYDIKVFDKDGNELQPEEGADVKVSFSMDAVANENLETNVYHISEDASGSLSADILPTEEDGTTVSASTDGFSYYTVEFTYDEKQYVMQGDSNVALVDILSFVGITKADGNAAESSDISAVSISNEELFSASNESGEWIVTANQAFHTDEWMKVTIDGVEYEIVVTDALQYVITVTESSMSMSLGVSYMPLTVDHIDIFLHKNNTDSSSIYLASGTINGGTGTITLNTSEPANYITIIAYASGGMSNGVIHRALKSSDSFTTAGTVVYVAYNCTIPSADPTYTAPTARSLTYNGSAQTLVNSGSVTSGGTMEYAIGSSNTSAPTSGWSTTAPTETNVGTYYVWWRINETDGYNAVAAKCLTSSIGQADNPITYANQTWNYTFATSAQTKNLNQATNAQGTITYSLQSQTGGSYFGFNTSTRVLTAAANTPVGTYTVVIRASADGNTNYKSGTKDSTVTVTIGKNSSSATAPIAANKTYNGSAQTIAAGGSASGGTIYYGLGSSTTSGPSSSSWSTTLPSATNAGDYYIWYKVTGDSNHNDVAATYAAKATISKRTVTPTAPTLTTGTLTYDGTDKTLANAGSTTAGGTMYYYVSTSSTTPTFSISTWEQSIDTKTDAGTYYIFWYDYVSDIANNNDTTTDKINSVQSLGSRTIGNATITVNAPNQSYTYTSNPQGTAITATSVNLQTVTIKYGTVSGTYDLITAPTATNVADSKTIYYQVTAPNHTTKTGSYTLTITKANASVTAPAANTLTYNGSAQALVTAGSTADGTLQYKLGTGGTYSSDIPTATNAGTYTVYYKVVGDANHNDIAEASLEVTIGPKSITPAANLGLADKYPAGAFPEVTIYDDDLHVAVPSSEYIISYSNINNPGEDATVTVSDRNGGNYTVATTTHTYTVENGIPTVTVAPRSVGSIEYNGAAQQLLANGGTALHGTVYYAVTTTATKPETSAYTITDPDAITGTEVGTYYIWYMVKGDTGYNDLYADGDGAYDYATITKKDITITAASASKNYDSTPLTSNNYTITSGELATGDEITDITITGTQTAAGSSNNVASGAVIMHGDTVVTSSYNITYAIGTLTVNRKAVTITADDGKWTYNGASHSIGTFSVTGMSEDDAHEFTVTMTTGSKITDAGTSSNVIYLVDGVLMTTGTAKNIGNYTVTTADGTLTVNKADSSITTAPVAKTLIYNGSAQELVDDSDAHFSGGTLQYRVGTTGDYSDDIPERTYAGTYTVYYRLAGDSNHNDSEGGSFEVTIQRKTVKVSGITASDKIYDGTVAATLVYTGTSFDGIVEGDTLSVTATGTFAAAEGDPGFKVGEGKTVNITDLTLSGVSVSNYVLSETGNQSTAAADITQKALTITADSDSKPYDGTALTKNTYTYTALATGDTIDSVTVTGSQTVVGVSDSVPSEAVIKHGSTDVSDCYNITYANGTLTVTKKAVTITADSDTKVYDGTALTKNSYTNTELGAGDSIENVTITGSQTTVGTSNNVPSNAVIKNAADVDVTASYDITYTNGTLEVIKKAVTITADSDTKVYDGTALTKDSVTSDGLITGDTIDSVTVVGSQINIGTSDNVPSNAVIKNAADEDVTASYEITYEKGTLEVTKRTLTITAGSDSKVYDGTALTKNSFTADGLATGDSIAEEDITITGSQTVVGSSDNVASGAVIKNANSIDVTANYEITYNNGTLTVTQASVTVTITGHNNTADYDGEEHSVSGYDVAISNTLYTEDDFTFSGTAAAVCTDAGTSSMGLAADQFTNNNDNFNITFNVTDGYQTITPINAVVTIVGNSNSTVYDGSEHSVTGYTATACLEGSTTATDLYDVANDFTFSGTAAAARTDAGTTNMGLAADQFVNTNPNFATVTFNVTDGYQTIEQIGEVTVSITGHNDAVEYDGESHSVSGYDVEISNPLYTESDFTFSGNASAERTDAGTTNMGLVESQFTNTNENFNTVNFVITDGYQTIDPINVTVTITGNNDTVDYDGESHVVTGYTATADSDLYDVDEDFTFNGSASASRTNAGTTDMGLAAAQFENTDTNFATVTFEVIDGYITVNKIDATVTIIGNNNTVVYDGEEHTVSGYTATADTDLYNVNTSFTFTGTATAAQTDVGTKYMELAADQFTNTNENFATVTFEVTDGYQTITAKSLTITADSDSKVYDGTALSKDTYTNTELAEGDSIESVVITGSQTNIGESDNVPSNAVIKNGDKDVIANYNITYVNGKLKVTPKTVTVKADNKSKKYGDTDPVCTATVTGTVGTDTVDYSFSRATGEDVGDYTITPSGDATQGNYAVTYETGKLTITKATLAIEAEAKEKTYGEDDPELTYTISGLQNSDTEDIMTGELSRAEGENTGTYAISQGTVAAGNNYNIDYTGANLTINRKEVTVKANDKTKTYGSPDPAYNATVNGMVSGENASDLLTYSFSREVGDAVGTYTITPSGNAVQGNYTVSYETGTLTIGKKTVTVTAKDKTVTYGDAPDNDGVEYSRFAYDEDESDLEGTLAYTYSYSQYGNVGEYTITPSGLTSENYAISFVNGTLTVEQKEVGIEWGETSFTYDGKSHMPTATATGLVNGDAITVSVSGARTAADTGYTATATSLTGAKAGNYKLPEDKTTTFSIGKKALTITADSDEKEYDGTALTKSSYTTTALIEGESIDSITITGSQTVAGTSSNTPSEAIIKNAAGGDVTSNYAITYVNGTLTVTAKAVTVMADDKTKVYGEDDVDLTAVVSGTVGEEKPDYTLSREAGEKAGEYTITVTAGDNPNYEVSTVNGIFTIERADITVTADNKSKVYGNADPELTATVTGLKRNDDETVIDYTLSRTVGEKAGTYDITAVGDYVQDNYNVQYESGLFTITEKIETAPDIKVAVGDYTYDGLEKLPEVSVYDGDTLIPADEYTVSYSDNTGAGTATITITDKEGGNYTVNGETTFIINKADQDAPEEKAISVKNATDGTSNDGIIEGVNDSMEYSTDGGKSWKSVEEGKTSIDGLGAGEVLIRLKADKNHNSGAAITVTIPAQGDVEVYLRKIGDAPTITVRNSKAELAGKLLSDTEKESIKDGEDVDIYLTEEDITDSISDVDRKLIESALNDGEAIGLYLDVNLYKKVGNAEPVQITDTNGYSIRLGINLPDILVNKDSKVSRSFRVLRLHDSSVKEVPSQYNGDEKRIDTESDRFSIFAIVYKDVTEEKTTTEDTEKEKTTTEESGKNSTEKPNKEETATEKKTTPSKVEPYAKQNDGTNNANTGDGTPIAVIILIMMLSLGICVAIIRKKKNHVE